jgi:hypothetical protein
VAVVVLRSGSPTKETAASTTTTTTRPAPKIPRLKLRIGPVVVQNVGPPAQVRQPVRRELLHVLQRYVDDAIIAPLEHGHVVKGYGQMYDKSLWPSALHSDLGVLTEANTGFRHNPVRAAATPVRLDAIGGPDGRPALVTATFDLTVDTPTAEGALKVRRHVELTFQPVFGRWIVVAYREVMVRSGNRAKKAHAKAG